MKKIITILTIILLIFPSYSKAEIIDDDSFTESSEEIENEESNDSSYFENNTQTEEKFQESDTTDSNNYKTETDSVVTEKKDSNYIVYVEIFCGVIGIIMLIIANKTKQ